MLLKTIVSRLERENQIIFLYQYTCYCSVKPHLLMDSVILVKQMKVNLSGKEYAGYLCA